MSCRVHEYDFSGFDRGDGDSTFARNRDAVALPDLLVIHQDSSPRGNEIAVSGRGQRICNALLRLERCAEYPGVGLNPQSILVLRKSAREWHEPTRALHFVEGFSSPGGIESKPTGQEPDLKDSQACVGVVALGVPYSTASGDRLHVPRTNLTPTTRTVLVSEYAFAHICDDLDVAMPVHREATVRGDLVVVPDHETPEPRVRGVALTVDGEVMPRFERVVISTSQGVQSSKLQHRVLFAGSALR